MGKFIIKATKTGFKFDLLATNGQVIASSQVYKSLKTCRAGAESVMKNAPKALIQDATVEEIVAVKNPKFNLYVDKAGEYRFNLTATNGQIIAVSEGYKKKPSAINGIESVQKNAKEAPIEVVE